MITKAKKVQFTTSDGGTCDTIEEAKRNELLILIAAKDPHIAEVDQAIHELVKHPREAIAILRLGLPRKPRTAKPKAVKKAKQTKPELPAA